MDAPPLPDDPRDWPADPFALLGVPRSVSEADLKRAYTRLIRKYKPDHAPDEFRRIREAYEAAIEMSRWYRDAPPHAPDVAPPFPAVTFSTPVPEAASAAPDPVARPGAGRPPADPIAAAWADAGRGAFADAYAALLAVEREGSNRADVPLRLYWLLALRPALDADRTRHDWLALALTRAGLGGPAVELYRRELATTSDALYGPYAALLDHPGAHGPALLALAGLRLDAAAAHECWTKIELDLEALARRVRDLDEVLWLDYLANVIGRIACRQPSVALQCTPLLANLKHLELRHPEAFDRIDRDWTLAELWTRSLLVPEPIRRAVAFGWGPGRRGPLRAVAEWARAAPAEALRKCDQVNGQETPLLAVFAQILEAHRDEGGPWDEFPPELVRGLVRARLAPALRVLYAQVRPEVLQFLLAERIDPSELVAACAVDGEPLVRTFAARVREDGALALVYRAATAFG
ncbi:J domain-containing protein [Gemmata sp. JC717]|uniref:J domain-containing protein n=1 Tax=Gemmata algarum TaxID=2975278 RepID=UPI0021BBA09C|nr:J domain-containing protein [Gemmata algarum]MDY3556784.1 J domain-containing protein [Gemmata algarum]